jgi:DNA replication protein DnaC
MKMCAVHSIINERGAMLLEQTIEKLYAMKLIGMAQALKEQMESTEISSLCFEERIGLLIDQQWSWKQDRALNNRIKKANFKLRACNEDIDFRTSRGLSKSCIVQLGLSHWIGQHQNCIITGPTGVGKTYLACALGQKACRNGYRVLYYYVPKLFRNLQIAAEEGELSQFFNTLSKFHLLIIDDWGMERLTPEQYRDFLEILDDRHQSSSTLLTSQFPLAHWHDHIGDPTIADAILDRLIHNCYKIEMKGESMRKLKNLENRKKSNNNSQQD